MLPPDGHVHTEWSWDAVAGSMERSCARAVDLGLPSIAFTEHADFTRWVIEPELQPLMRPVNAGQIGPDNRWNPPPLDTVAYLDCVARCRDQFPGLRILTGMELGEPHWHEARVKALPNIGDFDRLLGSVHSLALDGPRVVDYLFGTLEPAELMRAYLAEVLRLAESPAPFAVLAHIDYPVRYWPAQAGPFDAGAFEDEYRAALGALAALAGRSRSTPWCRCPRRSRVGGTRRVVRHSRLAAMPTSRRASPGSSPARPGWPRPLASGPAATPTTCGGLCLIGGERKSKLWVKTPAKRPRSRQR